MNISIPRDLLIRRSTVGSGLVAALALLCIFYSIVAGAVDRAAQRRATLLSEATTEAYRPAVRATARSNLATRAVAFSARNVSYVRSIP